ncbi:MAG: MMPL family transporter, partial [Bacteriovoracaceae bacterium]|nr:MMPL family transporter [Bacteriovoracaceae bacterium]
RKSLTKNFYPTILTTITTSLGFLSFFDAKVQPVSQLGIAVGLGAVFAWLSTYFLLGPILALLPKFSKKEHKKEAETFLKEVTPHTKALAFADFVIANKYYIVGAAIVLGSLGLFFSKDLVVNMDPIAQFRPSHPIVKAYNLVEEKLGFVGTIEIVVKSDKEAGAKDPVFLAKIESFEKWLLERPYVTSVLSINDYLKKINQAFNAGDSDYYKIPPSSEHVAQELLFYSMGLPPEQPIENRINAKRDSIRISVNWKLKDSVSSNEQFDVINQKAKELGLSAKVTGKTPLFHDLTPYIVSAFTHSFTLAVLTISLALWFIFQSLKFSIFAMIPSLLPLSIGAGLYTLAGFQVDMGTALVASVCLGIAVDDSVHFLFAYKSLIKEKSFRETLADIVSNVYPSLFNTTLLLAIGFSVLLLGNYVPNAKFGASVSIVLIIALISDFLVLPAILAIMHKQKSR